MAAAGSDSCSEFVTFFLLLKNIFILLHVCLKSGQYLENFLLIEQS